VDELARLRREIAALDGQILDLVARRLEVCRRVGEAKRQAGLPIRDFRVEVEVLRRARQGARRRGLDPSLAEDLLRRLIAASVETQREVAETGYRGTLKKVLVVGGAGRMGRWLCRFFASQGHQVAVSDPQEPQGLSLEEGVAWAEVVVLSTPVGVTAELFERCLSLGGDPLIFDICSLKGRLVEVLTRAAGEGRRVASLHPMFAPGATLLSGRALLVCQTGHEPATAEAESLFSDTALGLFRVPLAEHDRLMAALLGASHLVNLQFGLAMARSGLTFAELGRLASTTFARQAQTAAEVADENRQLYYEIQHFNPHTPGVAELLRQALEDLYQASRPEDPEEFRRLMGEARAWFHG
jgi:chorismate mutase/prephenate dehydrogenase